ncbi:hypothetical protein SBADM41S_04926 [Streptomyces badius]
MPLALYLLVNRMSWDVLDSHPGLLGVRIGIEEACHPVLTHDRSRDERFLSKRARVAWSRRSRRITFTATGSPPGE